MTDKQKITSSKDRGPARVSFLTLTASVTAGLVVLSVLAVWKTNEISMRRTLTAQAETQLILEARNLAVASGDALLSDYPELTLVPLVKEMGRTRPELSGIVVVNHEGRIKGHPDLREVGNRWFRDEVEGEPVETEQLQSGESMIIGPDLIVAFTPVRHHRQGTLGMVAMGLDRSFIEANIHEARRPLIKVAAGLLVLSIILVVGLLSVLFRPLKAIEAELVRIGDGDLDTPLPVKGTAELSRLAETLNGMSSQLKSARALAKAREQEIIDTQREVITTLGDVVESRSRETANHTRRVGVMSRELALLAGLDQESADLLRLASPMHDVGKIGIPDNILNKPGKLTPEEYTFMQNHATIGYEILKASKRPIMQAAAVIAKEHHERWDGAGYPHGVKGEDIHIFARITALVDVYDALSSDRVYRPAMPLEKILAILEKGRGTHFDPRLVDLFLENLEKFLAIGERYADTAVKAPVVPALDDIGIALDQLQELCLR